MTQPPLTFDLASTRLDNGLEVIVAPDADAPGVAVNLWVEVGSADEVEGRTGFAHLFEHLMFQGSENVASGEHMATVEAMGGTVNATTSTDRTNYFETVPRGGLELALWLEADRFASLAITPENFEAQRQVVKEEKRQRYDNQPYGDLLELLVAQHFPAEHPYGHLTIGSMAHLDDAALDDVAGFFRSWYRAANTSLVLCGPVTPDEGVALADRYFGALPQLPATPRNLAGSVATLAPQTTTVVRAVPHSLSYLSWDLPIASHPDMTALDLALMILADGPSSRLHKSLVRTGSAAHEIHGAALTHRSAASIATILGRPTEDTSTEHLAAAIFSELDRFIQDGPTGSELARAKAQSESDDLWGLATTTGRADAINEYRQLYGSPASINDHLSDVAEVTAEDVARAAAQWLRPNNAHQLHYLAEDAR